MAASHPSRAAAWSSAFFRTTPTNRRKSRIRSGDRLVFYTDGITEARNPEGDEYGEERLTAAALDVRTLPPEPMKDALLADVNGFTGGRFDDDATLIVVAVG